MTIPLRNIIIATNIKKKFKMFNFFQKLFSRKEKVLPSENAAIEIINNSPIRYIIVQLSAPKTPRTLYLGFKKAFKPEDLLSIRADIPKMPNFVWIDKRPLACEFVARDEAELFVEKCLDRTKGKIVIVPTTR